jgi:hypothetical protein
MTTLRTYATQAQGETRSRLPRADCLSLRVCHNHLTSISPDMPIAPACNVRI